MCLCQLHELSAAGASGSVFYASDDDEFIIKTVQKREAEFLLKLLPGYFLVRTFHLRSALCLRFSTHCTRPKLNANVNRTPDTSPNAFFSATYL